MTLTMRRAISLRATTAAKALRWMILGITLTAGFAQQVPAQAPARGGSLNAVPNGAAPNAGVPNAGVPIAAPHAGSPMQSAPAAPSAGGARDTLGPGDQVRVTVFRYPDLTTEARISDQGSITFPMVGEVKLAGLTAEAGAARIAQKLKEGKFLLNPQVQMSLLQLRSRQVSVLGDVARPGRYALEDTSTRLTDIIAMAGGMSNLASDTVTIMSNRGGKPIKTEVNVPALMKGAETARNVDIQNGDTVFVPRAPVFYIYGEVQRGGVYKLEDKMTIMQAISLGGGITLRGSDRRLVVRRKGADGQYNESGGKLTDVVHPDDVIYVKESFF